MSDTVIQVANLGKLYKIGERERYKALRDTIMDCLVAPWRRLRSLFQAPGEAPAALRDNFIWALKDFSCEVKRGEVVGIIGRNGAGKTTLLKILSRITDPTTGYVEIKGRVGSLLEVGTGFHPELTGRENIYLNGAILGMRKAEIERKFDEIVAFAEVEKFIDTPVKHYSTGMYVRLAFAVAAHLETEIMLVDEVLAVGDAAFQKKCLGKMGKVAQEGRTVLFVSHNLASLAAICETSLLLEAGALSYRGPIREGINQYLSSMQSSSSEVFYEPPPEYDLQFKYAAVLDEDSNPKEVHSLSSPIRIIVEYEVAHPLDRVQVVCHIWNLQGVHVLATADIDGSPGLYEHRSAGNYRAEISIPPYLLAPGNYQVSLACGVPNMRLIDDQQGPAFEVSALHSYAVNWSVARQDVVVGLPLPWKTVSLEGEAFKAHQEMASTK